VRFRGRGALRQESGCEQHAEKGYAGQSHAGSSKEFLRRVSQLALRSQGLARYTGLRV
jgi:hypothetical protein